MRLPEVRERTPDRPGPGPTPAALLRALDLTLARRVQGIMPGEHKAPGIGGGIELAAVRPYVPGADDVRAIDWNVTARMREPHVRVTVAERALTTWLLLDASASMHFGTADRRKADVAEGVALVIGQLATKRSNRLGIFAFGGTETLTMPPRQGRAGLLGLLLALREDPPATGGGATSLGTALRRAGALARQGGLVVLVSDFRGPQDWLDSLRAIRARHSVLCVEIRDPREQELPAMGVLSLVDPETGRQVTADTRSRKLRERFAAAAASEREQVAQLLRDARVDHAVLSTSGDWLRPLAKRVGRGLR